MPGMQQKSRFSPPRYLFLFFFYNVDHVFVRPDIWIKWQCQNECTHVGQRNSQDLRQCFEEGGDSQKAQECADGWSMLTNTKQFLERQQKHANTYLF